MYARISFDYEVWCPHLHDPVFIAAKDAIQGHTAVPWECLWTIYQLARQSLILPGEFMECGVDRGGTARFLADTMTSKRLHLFDTFAGMPETDPNVDFHQKGDFPSPGIEAVRAFVGNEERVVYHTGLIPDTFAGMEDMKIAFAHVDCDIFTSTSACCEFIYPRLARGGSIVFDDYGRPTCQGVRAAVDHYFSDKIHRPISIPATSQAFVIKI